MPCKIVWRHACILNQLWNVCMYVKYSCDCHLTGWVDILQVAFQIAHVLIGERWHFQTFLTIRGWDTLDLIQTWWKYQILCSVFYKNEFLVFYFFKSYKKQFLNNFILCCALQKRTQVQISDGGGGGCSDRWWQTLLISQKLRF